MSSKEDIKFAVAENNLQVIKSLKSQNFLIEALSQACLQEKFHIVHLLLSSGVDPKKLHDRVILCLDWCYKFEMLFVLFKKGAFNLTRLTKKSQAYISLRQKIETRAANKIGSWWIPICYDLNRECGRRMMEKSWERIQGYAHNEN